MTPPREHRISSRRWNRSTAPRTDPMDSTHFEQLHDRRRPQAYRATVLADPRPKAVLMASTHAISPPTVQRDVRASAARAGPGDHLDRAQPRSRWWVLAVVGIAQLMVVLDGTIVSIALPSAQRALG